MTITTSQTSRTELLARRDAILRSLNTTLDELRSRRESGEMTPDEWAAWEDLDSINYLLG